MLPKIHKETPVSPEIAIQLNTLSKTTDTTTEEWKLLGNRCFANGSFLSAIRCYTKAINIAGGDTATMRSNRSAAYLKSTMHSGPAMALKDAEKAVELDPSWYKGYLRVADAQHARHKLDEALRAYEQTLSLEPSCESAKGSLHQVKKEIFLRDLERKENTRQQTAEQSGSMPPHTERHTCDESGSTSHATSAPQAPEFHNAPLFGDETLTGQRRPPSVDETQRLIQTWSQDTTLLEGMTAMKPRSVTLDQVDRSAGQQYKQRLLGNFRSKLNSNERLCATVRERSEREQLHGDGLDYRHPEIHRITYARATNGIGLAISADAYKTHFGLEKTW